MFSNFFPNLRAKVGALISKNNDNPAILDVSHHNGQIDWAKVASQTSPFKVEGVIIKASTGVGSRDPKAAINGAEAKRNGLKIGYYHYCSLNEEDEIKDAKEEALWFIKVLHSLPTPDYPVVLDIEDPKIYPSVNLDPQEIFTWIKTFFKTLVDNGYKDYVLYSYKPFLDSKLPKNHGLGNIKLWIAQYRPKLTLPNGWFNYWVWQYSDSGKVNGIKTNVDLNRK
jgi:lysozyme